MYKLFIEIINENDKKTSVFIYRWFAISLVLHLIVAWFSIGFYHFDEHFQILEFAGYKIGHSPASALPWEFEAQIRSAFQPFIAYCVLKLLFWVHIDDPFFATTILRFMSAFLGWFSSVFLTVALLKYLQLKQLRKWFIVLSSILSSLFMIHARFSSESWAGSLAFLGIAIMLMLVSQKNKENKTGQFLYFLFCGFLFGLSYLCRVQSVFLYPGLFLWLFFLKRVPIYKLFIILMGIIAAVTVGILLDYWFYGVWVNTAYRYFIINILQGKAAEFGTQPWWWYLPELIRFGFWPLQLLMISLVGIAFLRHLKNPLVWVCVPFILVHFLVGHKELRFLFPLVEALPFLLIIGIESVLISQKSIIEKLKRHKKYVYILGIVFIIYSAIEVINMCEWPMSSFLYPMKYIYVNYHEPTDVIINDSSLNMLLNGRLKVNYYKRQTTRYLFMSDPDSIKNYAASNNRLVLMMISSRGFDLDKIFMKIKPQLSPAYCQVPIWLKKIDVNHWESRTSFWKIYAVNHGEGNLQKIKY